MQAARDGQGKGGNGGAERFAIAGDHVVVALHGGNGGGENGTAGVGKAFAGFEVRLFADHPFTMYLLDVAVGVGDDPVAAFELGADCAAVAQGNGVGEDVAILVRQ